MEASARSPRRRGVFAALLAACILACAGFVALGLWQVERLGWKEALIARAERNVNAAPVPVPGPSQWGAITPDDEYRRMQATGRYDFDREVLVAATTELGSGYWVLTPLRTAEGWVLVNRGFVPPEVRTQVPRGTPEQSVTGLLRFTEPERRMLQKNDPAAGRWYSRDVAAIATKMGLEGPVAPFFLDARAEQGAAAGWPRAGLTVLQFRNHHLVYALTWFALAAIMAGAIAYLLLDARRARRLARNATSC